MFHDLQVLVLISVLHTLAPLPVGYKQHIISKKLRQETIEEQDIFYSVPSSSSSTGGDNSGMRLKNNCIDWDPKISVSFDTIAGLGDWERHTKGNIS